MVRATPIVDEQGADALERSYATCRSINRRHGTTYYWATKVLPRRSQPHVHALYGLCRFADDIVDSMDGRPPSERADALFALAGELRTSLVAGYSRHDVLCAVVNTASVFQLPGTLFDRFFNSMAQDLTKSSYATYEELRGYMDGSAAVIGEMMLPILDPVDASAVHPARDLGFAFQLTNFMRDVSEDLDRGRVYIPQEDLDRFGVDLNLRRLTPEWRELCRFEFARIRDLYRSADGGIALLRGRSQAAIRAARMLYGEILDEIERNDFDVFSRRIRIPTWRKVAVATVQLLMTTRTP